MFHKQKFVSARAVPSGATATTVLIGPVGIEDFDDFAMTFVNSGTAAFSDLVVQAKQHPDAPFLNISTAVLGYPGQLGSGSSVMSTCVNNCYYEIQVLGAGTATMSIGQLELYITGHRRV